VGRNSDKEELGQGGTWARRNLGKEELGQGGTWVQEGVAWDINSEGGWANGFCVYGRKGEIERI